ncbi:putative pentatricopeptide repeat-containing protein [Vitis vinifera]|uniref:Putative pentatricopeptide repeat-containing protein n=1 Tax=Vitis vinifera TaxID=29760 RepID=A0A438FQS3_VITVI|nr:putative pentatricopeptide repeat-containing protein [Vitis vinifera]
MYPLMTTIYHSFSSNSTHSEKLDSISPKLHAAVTKHGFESNLPVMNSILDMYCRCSCFSEANRYFYEMNQRDLITWNTLIAGYERSNPTETSRNLLTGLPENIGRLSRLIHLDFHQNIVVASSFKNNVLSLLPAEIGALSLLGTLDLHSNQIHGRIIRRGLDGNLALSNALIDMYSKCGNIADSHQVFGGMSRRDLVSWTTMMIGYGTHGYGEEVVELFDKMVSDLLGRAGKVEEAYELIESMPFKPDECVWGPFLGACKAHRFPNSRKLAAHRILDLRPNMAGTYVMLSNIYAADGKWGSL